MLTAGMFVAEKARLQQLLEKIWLGLDGIVL